MNNLNDPLFDKVLKVRNTILELLEDRGVDRELLPFEMNYTYIKYMIDEFISGKPTLDMLVRDKNKSFYVKYLLHLEKKTSQTDYGGFKEMVNVISESNRFSKNDDIILVIFDEDYNKDSNKERIKEVEKDMNSNVTLFFYKSLLFNISKHRFVPPHKRLDSDERKRLLKSLMIKKEEAKEKLPIISRFDPVCKYYGFKRGDVLSINRATIFSIIHTGYRLVV